MSRAADRVYNQKTDFKKYLKCFTLYIYVTMFLRFIPGMAILILIWQCHTRARSCDPMPVRLVVSGFCVRTESEIKFLFLLHISNSRFSALTRRSDFENYIFLLVYIFSFFSYILFMSFYFDLGHR